MRTLRLSFVAIGLVLVMFTASTFADYSRGPTPTNAMLEADEGPFDYGRSTVSRWSAGGYGGGTLFYPTNTSEGPFAGIVVCPGYMEGDGAVDWWGPRLASNGFVVMVMQPQSTYTDQPIQRANQILDAVDDMISWNSSRYNAIYGKLDTNRFGLMGHSMGGGGTLIATEDEANNPAIKAAIPLAPYALEKDFSGITAPTMIVACGADGIAPVAQHAKPFYNSLSSSIDKMFVEFAGDSHFCVIDGNSHYALLGKLGVSWMKVFLDEDARYLTFLNDIDYGSDWEISEFYSNRPYYVPGGGDDCQQWTSTNAQHVNAGRAYTQQETVGCDSVTTYYAVGSNTSLGTSGSSTTTLNTSDGGNSYYVGSCP